jgi:hypothetical protein
MSKKTRAIATEVVTYTTTVDVGPHDNIPVLFTFKTDGTGIAKCQQYSDDDEEIAFTWDPSILEGADDEIDDILSEHASTLFWEEINGEMDDPVLSSEDYGSEELVFESGSDEELERMVRLILYAFPALWEGDRDEIDLRVCARTENEGAHLDEYCEFMEDADIPDTVKSPVCDLIELCLEWIDPYGWSMEYNDGAYGRASGYSESPNTADYTISRPSFHELAEAREELLALFAKHQLAEGARSHLPEEGE